MKKPKVLVAMSGGVDSSVAALMMKQKGYEVIGAFMKNFSDTKDSLGECLWRGERKHAIKIASMLDIPLITLDFEKEYKKLVVDEMFKLYKKGITPNPDVDCNEKIKFPLMIKAAKKIGADYLVTGHYARIKNNSLLRGKDESKDQSYFLYRMKQSELKKTLFPIGNYAKVEIRKIAKENNFPNYDKKGTTGICFIGKINMKDFLKKKIKPKKGKVLDPEGNEIGTHDGIYYYTIGERLGPRYGFEINRETLQKTKPNEKLKRWYVAKKIPKKNILIAAPEKHEILYKKEIFVKNVHWINKNSIPENNSKVLSRIRQVGELLPSSFSKKGNKIKITLKKAITGVSEGQAIVLYKGKECLGGGVISYN